MLREGNQANMSWMTILGRRTIFSTCFATGCQAYDFVSGLTISNPIDVGGFSPIRQCYR